MNKHFLVIFLFINSIAFSQSRDALELCIAVRGNSFMSNVEAERSLEKILNTVGLSQNFVLQSCDRIENAIATSYKGVRYILYDKNFMSNISNYTNDWSNMLILAHEVGHHINGHSLDIVLYAADVVEEKSLSNRRNQELQADEFAGFVLAKLGAPLADAERVISSITTDRDDTYSTHPSRSKRINAIRKGYNKAGNNSRVTVSPTDDFNLDYESDMYEVDYTFRNVGSVESQRITSGLVNQAIEDSENKRFLTSARLLGRAYEYSGEIDYVYYQATNNVNGKDYESALNAYLYLYKKRYTGQVEKYFITEKRSKKEIEVSASEYNNYFNNNKYINPRIDITESKRPEIIKNIALIYNELGYKSKALYFTKVALLNNPGDVGLLLTAANIYIELGDKEEYKKLINKALLRDPSNPVLYFNLGVVSSDQGDRKKAFEYYNKAIEFDPQMANAYLNLVSLILEDENQIVNEMNNLGNSRADDKRYDELSNIRKKLYQSCVPILRKLISISKNIDAITTLKNIYITLENKNGVKEIETYFNL